MPGETFAEFRTLKRATLIGDWDSGSAEAVAGGVVGGKREHPSSMIRWEVLKKWDSVRDRDSRALV
jgi:hypothetical protein